LKAVGHNKACHHCATLSHRAVFLRFFQSEIRQTIDGLKYSQALHKALKQNLVGVQHHHLDKCNPITSGAVLLDARHRCTQRKMEMDRSSLCGFAWSRTLWILGGSCCLVPSMPTLHAWVGPLALCCTPALTQKPIICGIVARSMPAQEKPNELLQVAEEQLLSLEKQMMFGQSCV